MLLIVYIWTFISHSKMLNFKCILLFKVFLKTQKNIFWENMHHYASSIQILGNSFARNQIPYDNRERERERLLKSMNLKIF